MGGWCLSVSDMADTARPRIEVETRLARGVYSGQSSEGDAFVSPDSVAENRNITIRSSVLRTYNVQCLRILEELTVMINRLVAGC
jgi:hypothetical protein